MKKQKVKSQMKGQDRPPEKQLNEGETGNLPEKRIQNNDSDDDPGSWENSGEDPRNGYQRPRRTNKQIGNTLERISIRITEAEEWISDLEDRMVEIIATEQTIQKGKK